MQGRQPRVAALLAQLCEAYKRHNLGGLLKDGTSSGVEVVKRIVGARQRGEVAGILIRPTRQSHIGPHASLGRQVPHASLSQRWSLVLAARLDTAACWKT